MRRVVWAVIISGWCLSSATPRANLIQAQGMEVTWSLTSDEVIFKLRAPHTGWVAIGINESDNLTGTNLIMATVSGNAANLSDRSIIAPGDHRSVETLGCKSHVRLISGSEQAGATNIQFALKLQSSDRYHYSLSAGKKIWLLMAYSESDDLMHHSLFRTSKQIML